jgi:hypothetical protein
LEIGGISGDSFKMFKFRKIEFSILKLGETRKILVVVCFCGLNIGSGVLMGVKILGPAWDK